MEENWLQIWEKNKILVILGLGGLILVGIGVFSVLLLGQKEAQIEILPAEEAPTSVGTIFVDIEGAVEKPGVYELPADLRLNDLLIQAGGLSAQADREWAEKNLNLAQKLVDGAKIFIPKRGEQIRGATTISGLVNINTATQSELDSLWGIGEKRAQAIIDNRPYQSIEELLNRKIIPSNVYEKIKDEISVY